MTAWFAPDGGRWETAERAPPRLDRPRLEHPGYRSDIDGMRALAVLAVVVFHAFPSALPGGFIGVDVFFVLSGFLISTIIFVSQDQGAIALAEFYMRRVRRIFPALLLVLFASFALGWFALLADEFGQLGQHILGGAGFVSNFVLWSEAGYFDNAADTKPLLHLWSLGIEEQFYLLWPWLVWLCGRWKLDMPKVIGVVALGSIAWSLHGVTHDSVAAFYSPQTRIWELLAGSLLAWFRLRQSGTFLLGTWGPNVCSAAGLMLLAGGFICMDKGLSFPGAWALVPVGGAVLLILAGHQAWFNREILSRRAMVSIGLISYPLYLWHWPLLSFARIIGSESPGLATRSAAVLVAILLAWLTYRYLEQPVRTARRGRATAMALMGLMAVAAGVGYLVQANGGWPSRLQERNEFISFFDNRFPEWSYFKRINLATEWRNECAFFNDALYMQDGQIEGDIAHSKPRASIAASCHLRDPNLGKAVLIWGDSHAQVLSPGLRSQMPADWQVLQVATSGCRPDPHVEMPSAWSQCQQSNYFAIKTMREALPDVVVIAQARDHSVPRMAEIAAKLQGLGVGKILFLGPVPHWKDDLPKIVARQLWLTKPRRTSVGVDQNVVAKNLELMRAFGMDKPMEFVDVMGYFCDARGCLTHTGENLQASITTWDYGHLTPSASRHLAQGLLVGRILGH